MRLTRSRWLVSSALLFVALAARAETRPHYGGTLRIETQQAITAVPADADGGASPLSRQIARLLFDDQRGAKAGSGPFKITEFVAGKKLTLTANDDFRQGRPYLDSIEILMGRSPREQRVDFQLGRADVIDVPVDGLRRAAQEGVPVVASAPIELVAIVFSANGAGGDSESGAKVREAISLSADRAAIFNVLTGRQGEPTAALVPNWISGYGFLFDTGQNTTRAKQLAVEAGRAKPLTLAYDPQDGLAKSIAERVSLDARAAGLVVLPSPAVGAPDARVVRILIPYEDPRDVLAWLPAMLGGKAPTAQSPEEQFAAEKRLRDELRVVPLLHLPVANGLAPRVKDWNRTKSGAWSLESVWLEQRP
ncbi:MAG TPA: ABC transporter substrate-binding protein [Terriglobales bacterium]|nr:ABC transporter substrate-binding protein [Terriglobales bacterium]